MSQVGINFCHLYLLLISVDPSNLNVLLYNKTTLSPVKRIWKKKEKQTGNMYGHQKHTSLVSKSSSKSPWSSSQRLYITIRVPWSFRELNCKQYSDSLETIINGNIRYLNHKTELRDYNCCAYARNIESGEKEDSVIFDQENYKKLQCHS